MCSELQLSNSLMKNYAGGSVVTLRKLLGGFCGLRQPCTPGGSSSLQPTVKSSSLSQVSCLKVKTKSREFNRDRTQRTFRKSEFWHCTQLKKKVLMLKKCQHMRRSCENVWNQKLILLYKDRDVTWILLSFRTLAGLTTPEGGGIITPPCSTSFHWGPTVAPRTPAAPVTIHFLCACNTVNNNFQQHNWTRLESFCKVCILLNYAEYI